MALSAQQFKTEIMKVYPQMRGMALRMLKNSEDVADALQDTATSLWNHRNALEKAPNRKAYILRTLRNCCVSHLRSSQATESLGDVESKADGQDIDDFENRDLLTELLRSLPETQQKVMALKISSYDNESIAKALGLSYDNVRQILSRARRTLRQSYFDFLNKSGTI